MFSKSMFIGSFIIGAVASLSSSTAGADNINTSGTTCQNYNASQALDIDYLGKGVRNVNASARSVICSVPRSPRPAGTSAEFFVNGHNDTGTSTSCTLIVTSYLGAPVTSFSFTRSAGDWDQPVTFAAGAVSTYDYVSLLCTLPGGGAGLIHGITAVQP